MLIDLTTIVFPVTQKNNGNNGKTGITPREPLQIQALCDPELFPFVKTGMGIVKTGINKQDIRLINQYVTPIIPVIPVIPVTNTQVRETAAEHVCCKAPKLKGRICPGKIVTGPKGFKYCSVCFVPATPAKLTPRKRV